MRILREGMGEAPPLPGQSIEAVRIGWDRHIVRPSVRTFKRKLRERTIADVRRRGKFVVLPLDRGTLLIHLMMSGDLRMAESSEPPDPYAHTVFRLRSGWELRFSDSRKFGRVFLLDDPEEVLAGIGPEPLEADFTTEFLADLLKRRRRAIKPLLLDQRVIAGIGNIYADEALHRAKVHPRMRSDQLNPEQVEALWGAIRFSLSEGIKHNGASIDWVYRGGDFQNHFRVHRRAGEPCPICGTAIERTVVAQRGTYYCPICQLEDGE